MVSPPPPPFGNSVYIFERKLFLNLLSNKYLPDMSLPSIKLKKWHLLFLGDFWCFSYTEFTTQNNISVEHHKKKHSSQGDVQHNVFSVFLKMCTWGNFFLNKWYHSNKKALFCEMGLPIENRKYMQKLSLCLTYEDPLKNNKDWVCFKTEVPKLFEFNTVWWV